MDGTKIMTRRWRLVSCAHLSYTGVQVESPHTTVFGIKYQRHPFRARKCTTRVGGLRKSFIHSLRRYINMKRRCHGSYNSGLTSHFLFMKWWKRVWAPNSCPVVVVVQPGSWQLCSCQAYFIAEFLPCHECLLFPATERWCWLKLCTCFLLLAHRTLRSMPPIQKASECLCWRPRDMLAWNINVQHDNCVCHTSCHIS